MMRLIIFAMLMFGVAACHTTQMGRSVGWPEPQRTSR
jgi:hypothetical protein